MIKIKSIQCTEKIKLTCYELIKMKSIQQTKLTRKARSFTGCWNNIKKKELLVSWKGISNATTHTHTQLVFCIPSRETYHLDFLFSSSHQYQRRHSWVLGGKSYNVLKKIRSILNRVGSWNKLLLWQGNYASFKAGSSQNLRTAFSSWILLTGNSYHIIIIK